MRFCGLVVWGICYLREFKLFGGGPDDQASMRHCWVVWPGWAGLLVGSLFVESVSLLIGVWLSWGFELFGFLKLDLFEFCLVVTFYGRNHNPQKVMF